MARTLSQRIVDTLQARSSGVLPADFDEQLVADLDAMSDRYAELRREPGGFAVADRIARTEFVDRLLTSHHCQASSTNQAGALAL